MLAVLQRYSSPLKPVSGGPGGPPVLATAESAAGDAIWQHGKQDQHESNPSEVYNQLISHEYVFTN